MPINSPHAQDKVLIAFGAAVRHIRKENGISQEELALKCEIDRSYMGSIERGQQNSGLLHISRIANALDISIAELMSTAGL
ncbi:helix-turn-helix transcriptional regulator [Undibacterium sp. CY18W]|uniref:Helix-turn-helix transcriptional regulator n=1 Tax=Undibacterium hunanense TaxID=2762292 RepID=A0ABR6ZW64_9BURK|nr:helix-turn-helix transcriptional regulator [Undibacterium hunanense]MBC3920065.1 helix-turn-helix transcriptional regulator [Undibacterium hunanense]